MVVFVSLSKFVIVPIFSDWLNLEELCLLDSALCCVELRTRFLRLISSHGVAFNGSADKPLTEPCRQWTELRNLSLNKLNLSCEHIRDTLSHYFVNKRLSKLTHMRIDHYCVLDVHMWQSLAFNLPQLTSLQLNNSTAVSDTIVCLFIENCHELRELNLNQCRLINDNVVLSLIRNERSLTSLSVSHCSLLNTDCMEKYITKHGHFLRKFDISHCKCMNDAVLQALSENSVDLLDLNFNGCWEMTGAGVTQIAQKCVNLTAVSYQNCPLVKALARELLRTSCPDLKELQYSVPDNAIGQYVRAMQYLYMVQNPWLKMRALSINLFTEVQTNNAYTNTKIEATYTVSVSNVGSEQEQTVCQSITYLHLSKIRFLDGQLLRLVNHHHKLLEIDITYCEELTEVVVREIAKYCHLLQCYKASNKCVTDSALCILAGSCHQLQTIHSHVTQNMTNDRGLCCLFRVNPHLTEVRVRNKIKLTEQTLVMLSKHCHRLLVLDISDYYTLTDRVLMQISLQCNRLTHINLSNCFQLTEYALSFLVQNCINLVSVNVSHINITDRFIGVVSKHCKGLHTLTCAHCTRLTDASFVILAQNCVFLGHVDASHCDKLSTVSLVVLLEACPCLDTLNFEHCYYLSTLRIEALAHRFPRLSNIAIKSTTDVVTFYSYATLLLRIYLPLIDDPKYSESVLIFSIFMSSIGFFVVILYGCILYFE